MPHVKILRATALLLIVAMFGVAGCSDPDAATYINERTLRLSVDRPTAWTTPIEVQEPWTVGYRLGPDSIEQIQLAGYFGDQPTAAVAMGNLIGMAQASKSMQGFTIVESREVTVKGATTGQITRYTIDNPRGGQVTGTWITAARWPYPQAVAVSILTPTHDPDLERRVLDSLELHPEQS